MGIRIHKFIGYGLNDLKFDDQERLIDDRINNDALGSTTYLDGSDKEYWEWLEAVNNDREEPWEKNFLDAHYLKEKIEKKSKTDWIFDCIAHNPEYGRASTIVIRPFSCKDWSRYDDVIDYMEETYLYEPSKKYSYMPRVDVFKHGIYPFNALYMDVRTGERLDSNIMPWIRARSANEDEAPYDSSTLDELAKIVGFDNHQEADENVAPVVPLEIQDIANYLKLFTDDKVLTQLRPMLYTYWG